MDTSQTQIHFDIPLVILAGGKSSRMGEDKALLPFGGYKSLAEYQYKRLLPYFDKVYLSAKTNKFDFCPHIIYDNTADTSSPLIALQSILSKTQNQSVFILPVDVPMLCIESIQTLIMHSVNFDITIAQTKKNHYLCGVYSPKILQLIDKQISQNNHRIGTLISNSNSQIIAFENDFEFFNVNDKNEYFFISNKTEKS